MRYATIIDGQVVVESAASYRQRTKPAITKEHVFALQDAIAALQQARDEYDGRRYGYFAQGGWAGERLRELFAALKGS